MNFFFNGLPTGAFCMAEFLDMKDLQRKLKPTVNTEHA